MRAKDGPSLRIREAAVILATVSSDAASHGDVRAILDARFRCEAVWDLRYEDAARLHGGRQAQPGPRRSRPLKPGREI